MVTRKVNIEVTIDAGDETSVYFSAQCNINVFGQNVSVH